MMLYQEPETPFAITKLKALILLLDKFGRIRFIDGNRHKTVAGSE